MFHMTEGFGFRFPVGSFKNFQVTYSFLSHSLTMMSTQPITEVRTKKCSWGLSATCVYSWQICRLSCAECQSMNGSQTFYLHSESPCLFMRNSYLYIHLEQLSYCYLYFTHTTVLLLTYSFTYFLGLIFCVVLIL
jgi:hypothetical protein